jgi:hypothetical protein
VLLLVLLPLLSLLPPPLLLLLLLAGAWMEHVVDPMLAVKDELLDTFRR